MIVRARGRARVQQQRSSPVEDLIGADREDLHLEYKSTLRHDIAAGSHDTGVPERAVVKTVAGFLNSEHGGTLLIGVDDRGEVVGLEDDYATFSKRGLRGDRDLFGQHLENIIVERLGAAAATLVDWSFHSVAGRDLCRVEVEPADFPVYEGSEADGGVFWWRFPTGTRAVTDDVQRRRIARRRFAPADASGDQGP